MTVVAHPPYPPDLGPCDFLLKMKNKLNVWRFDTAEDNQAKS